MPAGAASPRQKYQQTQPRRAVRGPLGKAAAVGRESGTDRAQMGAAWHVVTATFGLSEPREAVMPVVRFSSLLIEEGAQ